jgi:hypothetical protein
LSLPPYFDAELWPASTPRKTLFVVSLGITIYLRCV